MDKITGRARGAYTPRTPSAVVDPYVIRFNAAATAMLRGFDAVDAYMDGKDIIIKHGSDLLLRHYAGGARLNSRALANRMEYDVYSVRAEKGGVRLCPVE